MLQIEKISKNELQKLPSKCGVYFFFSEKNELLYVGKAKNLKERVKTHFKNPSSKDLLFLDEIKKIGYILCENEVEALLKESFFIKNLSPKFNILFRDDKKYFYVGITKENWPRVFITHQPVIEKKETSTIFIGPFTEGKSLKKVLKILRKIFPYRSCKKFPKKPCLYFEIERCPGPCKEKIKIDKEKMKEYQKDIENLILTLEGKKEDILKKLEKEMMEFAKKEKFELAGKRRDQIESLKNIFSHKIFLEEILKKEKNQAKDLKEFFSLEKVPQRIEGYDISNLGKEMKVGSMIVFEKKRKKFLPQKKEYRRFKIKEVKGQNDYACLEEVLKRRFSHKEWKFPDLLFVDGGKNHLNVAKRVIKEKNLDIKVFSFAKRKEKVFFENLPPFSLDTLPQSLKMLILNLKNEAHRFAISFHKILRKKRIKK